MIIPYTDPTKRYLFTESTRKPIASAAGTGVWKLNNTLELQNETYSIAVLFTNNIYAKPIYHMYKALSKIPNSSSIAAAIILPFT